MLLLPPLLFLAAIPAPAAAKKPHYENRHPAEENGPHTSPYLSFYGRDCMGGIYV